VNNIASVFVAVALGVIGLTVVRVVGNLVNGFRADGGICLYAAPNRNALARR
jgi:hypothetical protein